MKDCEVIVVGAGPAGIFAALELSRLTSAKVLMIEKGHDLERRKGSDPSLASSVRGWGGAGAYSDGKLNLSPEVGGILSRFLSPGEVTRLIEEVDQTYLSFGGPTEAFGMDAGEVDRIRREAKKFGLQLNPSKIRHLGTENCFEILRRMREYLTGKVQIEFETDIVELNRNRNGRGFILSGAKGERFGADYVILAPGREGSSWLSDVADRLCLSTSINPVDIGLRVEVPASIMEPITRVVYEAKLHYRSKRFNDPVRTFCMCPNGEVICEDLGGLYAVNGQGYAHRKTENTNFAVLVSTSFTEPFKEPISYGKHIARLANLLGGEVIVQRFMDLQLGRRSTFERIRNGPIVPTLESATPGDLSFVLPYRHLANIIEMLEALDRLIPGINSDQTLLYGVEVKFYSLQLKLSPAMETEIPNLFGAGDGVGVSRGLVQASASGLLAAREVAKRIRGQGQA